MTEKVVLALESLFRPGNGMRSTRWLVEIHNNPINKNLKILNPTIFSENLRYFQTKYFGTAGWTDFWRFPLEYLDSNTF